MNAFNVSQPGIVKPPGRLGAFGAHERAVRLRIRPPKLMDTDPGYARCSLKTGFFIQRKTTGPNWRKVTVFQVISEQIP